MRAFALLAVVLAGLAGPSARADDTDPEPPGVASQLRQLKGTWTLGRIVFKDKELSSAGGITYTFAADRLTIDQNGNKRTLKVKIDTKTRPFTIEMIEDNTRRMQSGHFKIDKGELFLTATKAATTFDGATGPVMVLKAEKK